MNKRKPVYSTKGVHDKTLDGLKSRLRKFVVFELNQQDYHQNERLQGEVQAFLTVLSLIEQIEGNGMWISDDDEINRFHPEEVLQEELEFLQNL